MLIKQFISFILITLYLIYLISIRILLLFTSKDFEISISWVLTRSFLIFSFISLLCLEILRFLNIITKVNSYKTLTYITTIVDMFYFNANNFLNRFPRVEKTLYDFCSQFIYYCTKKNLTYVYIKYLVIPYITVGFVFVIEACIYKQLTVFYYVLPLTFITMIVKYLLYRCEHLYTLHLKDLTDKCLIQIAYPSNSLYHIVSLQKLIDILVYPKFSERIKVVITPSLSYINFIIENHQDSHVITPILNDRVENLIVFRRIQLDLNVLKTKYQPYLNMVLYSVYSLGWSFLLYHNITISFL